MPTRKISSCRPKPMTLETLAISEGIIESPFTNHPLVERLRDALADRGTDGSGFSDLQRRFQAIDREGSKCVTIEEFKIAFQRCNLSFTDGELSTLFYFFDCNQKNYIDYDDFIFGIRGPVSGERKELIERAFQQVDGDGEGLVAPEEIIDRYDPTQHPDVKNGIKKAQEVFRDFLRSFQVCTEVDGKVTKNEFENYYYNVSAAIDRDEYFELMMRNVWHLSPLDGWQGGNGVQRRPMDYADTLESRVNGGGSFAKRTGTERTGPRDTRRYRDLGASPEKARGDYKDPEPPTRPNPSTSSSLRKSTQYVSYEPGDDDVPAKF